MGGPLDGAPLFHTNVPGYAVDEKATVPTLLWIGGVTVYTLVGGPFEGGKLPFLPAGYEVDPDNSDSGVWTMNALSYNMPYPLDKLYPTLEGRYCSACGVLSRWRPASELTLVIHPVSGTTGHYRVYCRSHLPSTEWNSMRQDRRKPCPDCSMLMPMSGVCDVCS